MMKLLFSVCLIVVTVTPWAEAQASSIWFECSMIEQNNQKITHDRDGLRWTNNHFEKDGKLVLKTNSLSARVFPRVGSEPIYFDLELYEEYSHKSIHQRLNERVTTIPLGSERFVTITCDVEA